MASEYSTGRLEITESKDNVTRPDMEGRWLALADVLTVLTDAIGKLVPGATAAISKNLQGLADEYRTAHDKMSDANGPLHQISRCQAGIKMIEHLVEGDALRAPLRRP